MSKEITVRTAKGQRNSLRESVRIAATFTPADSEGVHPYDPIAKYVTTVKPDSDRTHRIALVPLTQFTTYKVCNRKVAHGHLSAHIKSSGDAVTLTNGWGEPAPHNLAGQWAGSTLAINRSGLAQLVAQSGRLAHHPLANHNSIIACSSWNLRVYIVGDDVESWHVLRPEDLRRPIFSTPVCWDTLPHLSEWVLSQDDDGVIRLDNEQFSHLAYPLGAATKAATAVDVPLRERTHPIPLRQANRLLSPPQVTESTRTSPSLETPQLSQVIGRLTAMEECIAHIRNDVTSAQQAITGLQGQLSALEKLYMNTNTRVSNLDRNIVTIETKTTALKESFGQSQGRLSDLQKATAGIRQHLTGLDEASDAMSSQVLDLGRRVPIVESKVEKMSTSLAHSHDRLSSVEGAVGRTDKTLNSMEKTAQQTKEQVSLVQQLVVSTNSQLSLMKQIPGGGAMELPPTAPGQPSNLEGQLSATEAQTEKMEKSLGQTQKQLASMRNVSYTMDRRIPIVESKADSLEISLGQTQAELIAVRVSLAGLDRRVAAVEAISGDTDFGGDHDVEDHYSRSVRGSPVTFPSHPIESPSRSRGTSPAGHIYPSR